MHRQSVIAAQHRLPMIEGGACYTVRGIPGVAGAFFYTYKKPLLIRLDRSGFRYAFLHGGRKPHSQQGLGEGQREHGGIAINRAINRRFRAVRVEQGQGAAVYQRGRQGDPHLAGSLGKLAAVDVAHGQQLFAIGQRAYAQEGFAMRDSAADDLDGSAGQRRLGAVAHRAAHGAEGDIQRRQLDDLTIDRLFMVAAAAQALRALRAVAVGRPLAIPVAAVRDDGIGVAIRAAGAGVQGVAVVLAGARDDLGLIIMPQRGQLHIGGVAAAGAGIVGFPAGLRAGSGLGGVMGQAMAGGGNFRVGGVAAPLARAGFIGFPAGLGAGGGFGGVVLEVVVVRVYCAILVKISFRSLVVAGSAVYIVLTRRDAGGLRFQAHIALHEAMISLIFSSINASIIHTAKPVLFSVSFYVRIRTPLPGLRKRMLSIALPAAFSAGSQDDAGGGAIAGAICRISCAAAIALAGAGVGFVVVVGYPSAPVVAKHAVLGVALYADIARGAGGRFVAAGMESTAIVENELSYVAACLAFGFRPMGHRVWRR